VAQAPGWATDAAAEVRYLQAERERLLYVAATRARDQLIITDGPDQPRPSCWAPLAVTIRDRPVLEVPELAPAGRQVLSEPAAALLEREVETAAGLAAARRIGWTRRTVTRMASEIRDEQEFYDLAEPGHEPDARAIGRVLHAVIEAMGRGRRGENLREFTLAVARGEGLDAQTQGRIADGLERLLASPALAAFLSVDQARFELSLAQVRDIDGHQLLVDGVLDAARQTGAGWEVVDWKLGGKNREARPDYRRQVEGYATMLAALTGQRADGRVVAVELR
jgi:ATP-dependent helicase/nuclease subunit A